MKILIVDDEALVRIGMRSIIPWEQYGYQVIGEANNGIEALRLARTHRPDIILVDIIMPEMNGLDFIKEIQIDLPYAKFIILSCKDEVDYYRKAIKLGVSEYIQKSSVSPDEILKVVERVSGEIRKHRVFDSNDNAEKAYINRNFILMEFFNLVLKGQIRDSGVIEEKLKSYGFNILHTGLYVAVFYLEQTAENGMRYDGTQDYPIINICQEIINDMGQGFVYKDYSDRITAIVFCPGNAAEGKYIKDLCYRIQETVNQFFCLKLTLGIGTVLKDYSLIHDGYNQAQEALNEKYLRGSGRIFFYRPAKDKEAFLVNIFEMKENLLDIKSPSEVDSFSSGIRKLAQYMSEAESMTPGESRKIYMDILYHIISLLRKEEIEINEIAGEGFNPIDYIEKTSTIWELNRKMELLLDEIRNYYRNKFQNRQTSIVSLIHQYVEAHIHERISLEDMSRSIHLSTSYISRLYKKETGENLQDYIVFVKVEKSKEMLRCNKNLNEIIENIGFSSESHFFKVFKAITGFTPGQYLKQLEK